MIVDDLKPFKAMKCAQDFWYDFAVHQMDRRDVSLKENIPQRKKRCAYHVRRSDEERRICRRQALT